MHRLRHFIALALLALWLPATLHCDLEAAGLDGLFSCADEHSPGGHDESSRDACAIIEGASFKPGSDTAVLPALALRTLCACHLALIVPPPAIDLTPPATGISDRIAAPPEVARTWHFVARAAPPARAPSLVS